MSSVYRAHDTVLERRVAIKVLHEHYSSDPEYVERFRREARAIARLAHPNVVTVIDRGEWDGRQYIVFEHVAGENLKAEIERVGALPVRRALVLSIQIARALAYAHELEIVHRDVKPHNVLLDPAGAAKVTDFGIARTLDVEEALTQTGTVLGTGQYLSPEQANGERGDERSDQYSLGVVIYELLTGEVPYTGGSLMAIAMRHVNDPVPSVRERRPEVPARLDSVVACAMAKSPEDRFPSMQAMVASLEACLAELPAEERARDRQDDTGVIAPPPSPPAPQAKPAAPPVPAQRERARRRRPRRGGTRLAVTLLGIAGIIAAGLIALQATRDDGVTGLLDGGGGEQRRPRAASGDRRLRPVRGQRRGAPGAGRERHGRQPGDLLVDRDLQQLREGRRRPRARRRQPRRALTAHGGHRHAWLHGDDPCRVAPRRAVRKTYPSRRRSRAARRSRSTRETTPSATTWSGSPPWTAPHTSTRCAASARPSTGAPRAGRVARARARPGGRGAAGTGGPRPRTASRRRSSP